MTLTDQTTDPSTDRWRDATRPQTSADWLERAGEVSDILAADAVERDRAGAAPHREVALLKASGLVTLLGPVEHGGGGQSWATAYKGCADPNRAD